MFKVGLGPTVTKETDGGWFVNYSDWQSYMGVTPENAPEGVLVAAVGVDGRERDTLKRHMGHVLLDDLKRAAMRADMLAQSLPGTNPLLQFWFSAERCALLEAQGLDPILQVEPFEISRHSSVVAENVRGFVLRMRQVLRKGSDESGANVTFSEGRPFIALAILSDHADAPLDDESRWRFILPLKPVSRLYDAAGGGSSVFVGLPHYNDGNPPNFAPADGSAATTPIYADDPVTVVSDARFVYLYSTTGEFTPVTLWFDTEYGLQLENFNFLMSNRSPGWHWEHLGVVLPQPLAPSQAVSAPAGLSSDNWYEFAVRYVDTYRNRYTAMSPRISWDAAINETRGVFGTIPSTVSAQVEQACNYDAYQFYVTVGATQVGGSLRATDRMTSRNTRMANRPQFYMDEAAASTNVFQVRAFNTTRDDVSTYTPYLDLIFCSDQWIANGEAFLTSTDPGDTPTEVLSGINLQGVTILATNTDPSGIDTGDAATGLTTRYVPSGFISLRWSATSDYAPEVFPTVNQFTTKISSRSPVRLLQVGDYGYLLGDGQIIRLRVVGTGLEILEMADGYFLENTKAACDVRGVLFGVFRDGAVTIEPTSGTPTRVPHLDRIIRTQWASTLASVVVEYDRAQDIVYMLNAELGQAVLLHPSTFKVTMLEGLRAKFLATARFQQTRRVTLWDAAGRVIVPRLYTGEDENGSPTTHALTQTTAILPVADRPYHVTVTGLTYSAPLAGTIVSVAEDITTLMAREGSLTPYDTDYYHWGLPVYCVAGAVSTYGGKYTLRGVTYGGFPASTTKLLIDGDVRGTLLTGTVLAIDPVPFAVMTGPLGDGTNTNMPSGTQKRLATYASVSVPFLSGNLPVGADLFEAGVVPPTDVLSQEPFTVGTNWVPLADTNLERDRRALFAASTFTGNGFAQIGTSGASGQLLLPYVRSWCVTPFFSLRESSIRGKLCASETLT